MNPLESTGEQSLLLLAKEKLHHLQALKKSLCWFCSNLEGLTDEEIKQELKKQLQYMEQIDEIDQKYQTLIKENGLADRFSAPMGTETCQNATLPSWYYDLEATIQEQQKLLSEIVAVNKKAQLEATNYSAALKEKMKQINQQKSILVHYYQATNNPVGNLFDYKEDKKNK